MSATRRGRLINANAPPSLAVNLKLVKDIEKVYRRIKNIKSINILTMMANNQIIKGGIETEQTNSNI